MALSLSLSLFLVLVLLALTGTVWGKSEGSDCDEQGVCFSKSESASKQRERRTGTSTGRKTKSSSTDCPDKMQNCRVLKTQGKCEADPGYMIMNCPRSCQFCHLQDMSTRCNKKFLNVSTERSVPLNGFHDLFSNVTNEFGSRYGVQVHSTDPWIVSFDNFLTDTEISGLKNALRASGNKYMKSVEYVGSNEHGDAIRAEQKHRTSSSAWCNDSCKASAAAKSVYKKIGEVMKIPDVSSRSESFQMLQYLKGQHYGPHHDATPAQRLLACGPRIFTFFLYFNDVEEGGETVFTDLGISVSPKKGRALVWPSVLEDDMESMDMRTRHEAKPVTKGSKYAANSWIHLYDFDTSFKWGCCYI